ncbi:MAG: hypothetical protein K8J09_08485, partial [Planctomycetes bacterium]|nr:hypothetical protein [Planctomycetota bacterium]
MRTPVALLLLPSLLAQAPSRELAEVAAAYAAKVAASAIFVSGRTLDSVLAEELAPTRPLERLIRPHQHAAEVRRAQHADRDRPERHLRRQLLR